MITIPPVLTKDELVDLTKISRRRIEEYVRDNKLVAHYSGTKPLFYAADVRAFLDALPTERAS